MTGAFILDLGFWIKILELGTWNVEPGTSLLDHGNRQSDPAIAAGIETGSVLYTAHGTQGRVSVILGNRVFQQIDGIQPGVHAQIPDRLFPQIPVQ